MQMTIKVLLADESVFIRLVISEILKLDNDIEVVATASNGKDALDKVKQFSPDVVVMDMNMGEYDGLYGIEKIIEQKPTPIIIFSSIGHTNFPAVQKGLALGAVDYINKPIHNTNIKEIEKELIQKIKTVAIANVFACNKVNKPLRKII